MKTLKLGTRGSELAVAQAESVARKLRALGHETELVKISLLGGDPTPLCEVRSPVSGVWATNGTIYFTDQLGYKLSRVPADGTAPREVVATSDEGLLWPQLLPGEGITAVRR